MDLDTIPLYEGELSGQVIILERENTLEGGLRSKRRKTRKFVEHTLVCFSPQLPCGTPDHSYCPLLDMSPLGVALEFDRALKPGVKGHVAYKTISHQPVRVGCTVRHCTLRSTGRYIIGLQFDRRLVLDECRPARHRPGREVASGVRARHLQAQSEN